MRCDAMRCDAMRCDAMRCDVMYVCMYVDEKKQIGDSGASFGDPSHGGLGTRDADMYIILYIVYSLDTFIFWWFQLRRWVSIYRRNILTDSSDHIL